MQVFEILQCAQGDDCLNSLGHLGHGSAKCGICRFAPNAPSTYTKYWKPTDRKQKHPAELAEKAQKKQSRQLELQLRKQTVDRKKQAVLKQAARAERATERNLIRATKNSGRSNRDGDHVAVGQITLDTKLQSNRDNPVVLLHELFKVREDAKRGGNSLGALVLRNRSGVGVVAIEESDFARLIERLS